MSLKIYDIIESAEGTIDKDLLSKQGDGRSASTGYLHDKPFLNYLQPDESLEYLFENRKKGITVTSGDDKETIAPNSSYRTILGVTSNRILCVVGQDDGDEVIAIPLNQVVNADFGEGFMKNLLNIKSSSERIKFYTRSDKDTSAATDYINRWQEQIDSEQSEEKTEGETDTVGSDSPPSAGKDSTTDSNVAQQNGQQTQTHVDGVTVERQQKSDSTSTSSSERQDSPEYVDYGAVLDSTLHQIKEAEEIANNVGNEVNDIDTARDQLSRAHNSLCQIFAENAPGIDKDGLEERIAGIEQKIDSLQTTARHLEETSADYSTNSVENSEGSTAEDNGDKKGDTESETPSSSIDSEEVSRREKMIDVIEEVAEELGRVPQYGDMHDNGPFKAKEYSKKFTSWQDALKTTDIDIEERLIEDLQSVAGELGRAPTKSEFDEYGTHSSSRINDCFGSYDEALSEAGLEKPSRATLLDELRRLETELGYVPTSAHVREHGDYPVSHYRKQFGSVRKAAEEDGLDYESDILNAIEAIAVGLGHRPKSKEFDEYASYSSSYIYNYFDGWRDACESAGVNSEEAVEELLSELSREEIEGVIENAPVTDGLFEVYTERIASTQDEETEQTTKSVLEDTIKAIAIALGRRPKTSDFNRFSNYSVYDTYEAFDGWTDACQAAGVHSDDAVEELQADLNQTKLSELLESAAVNSAFHEAYPDISSLGADNSRKTPGEQSDNGVQESLLLKLEEAIGDIGHLPTYTEMYDYDGINPQEYSEVFGSWEAALQETDINVEERLLNALRDVSSELGRAPTKGEVDELGLYDSEWYTDYFESWENAVREADIPYPTNEDLLDELHRLNDELGYVPARHHVEECGEYPPQFYRRKYDSVKQATAAAGMDYKKDVIGQTRELAIELERRPKAIEFDEHAAYSSSYVYDHFDTWGEACRAAGVDSDVKVKELLQESGQKGKEPKETTSGELEPSPLAEYYEVLGNLVAVQQALLGEDMDDYLDESEPMTRWHALVKSRWAGEGSSASNDSYGVQQNERAKFTMAGYREKYGNGDSVDDFQAIETAPLSEAIAELVSYLSGLERAEAGEIQIPKTPESGEALPVLVETTPEFERAEELLAGFPDKPDIKIDAQEGTSTTDDGGGGTTSHDDEDTDGASVDGDGQDGAGSEPKRGDELTEIGGVTESVAESLRSAGYHTKEDLKKADSEELSEIDDVGPQTASRIKLLVGS